MATQGNNPKTTDIYNNITEWPQYFIPETPEFKEQHPAGPQIALTNSSKPTGSLNELMIDPIAYRSDYNPADISGDWRNDPNIPWVWPLKANEHFREYWDDSSPQWQWIKWGMADKYEWKWVKNSFIEYDPNITTKDLDPNYVYGRQVEKTKNNEQWYIAKRNDMLASALFNEWMTSREDISNYLAKQMWWFDSTEADRQNTIESIWKRMWQITPQEQQQEKAEPITMWENKNQEELIYGKTTPETGNQQNWVIANTDDNVVLNQMNSARTSNMNALRSMDPVNAATSTYFGYTPYGDQTLRDVQQFDQVWYQQYQEALTKLYVQDQVDEIAHGSAWAWVNNKINSYENNIINDQSNWVSQNSDERTYDQVAWQLNKKLLSNQTANSAKQEMLNIKKDIANLNSELEDLPNKANKAFKWDVPDYIYQAYIANNTQAIQKKINNLENRYASLSDIYKTEVSQTQREMEFDLKKDQLEMDRTKMNFDMAYKTAQLEQDKIHWDNWKAYTTVNGQVIQLDDWTAYAWYQNKVNAGLNSIEQMAQANAKYWQCEDFTDDLAENTAWVRMVWANNNPATTSDEKNWYATQFGLFSDYIPEVWDVAVFDYRNAKNVSEDSRKYGHTMYVAWYDEATWMIHLVWSNGNWDLANKVYSKDISVEDFYKQYGVWFWNPYKYAQWQSMQLNNTGSNMYSPMQNTIDNLMKEYRDAWKTNMFSNLGTFQEIYTTLYQSDQDGQLSAVMDEWLIGTFLENMALSWAQSQGWDSDIQNGSALERFLWLNVEQVLAEADNYFAQHVWDEKAYAWFQDIMRAVEIKLRDESWAAINKSERATNFLLYLPKATDTDYVKNKKLQRLEEYIRRLGTEAWINSQEYIPLNLGEKTRSID